MCYQVYSALLLKINKSYIKRCEIFYIFGIFQSRSLNEFLILL